MPPPESAASLRQSPGTEEAARRAGLDSATATSSRFGSAAKAGTWAFSATAPKPMTAPRSLAMLEPLLLQRDERFFQDGGAAQGFGLGDDERRIDSERRVVGHR